MLRRLHAEQPTHFEFTPANLAWAKGQISKYPAGRQASAIIPLLWRAQEQEGWLTRPAIEHVADMLGMAYIRALEVATFYFMFQLQPVGSVAHIQICGTTSCMICGAEDLIRICRERISPSPLTLSADGKFSWEEVECLGACANAPMAQIGKDYYEDLTPEKLLALLDDMAAGKRPVPGPQNGRYASEPLNGLTALKEFESGRTQYNASVQRQMDIGDGLKRIDGTEVPLLTPWLEKAAPQPAAADSPREPVPAQGIPVDATGVAVQQAPVVSPGRPEKRDMEGNATAPGGTAEAEPGAPVANDAPVMRQPQSLAAPRGGQADDLKVIDGIGPKIEAMLHAMGFYHFDQLANWTAEEIAWVDAQLTAFKGRMIREKWVEQARERLKGK